MAYVHNFLPEKKPFIKLADLQIDVIYSVTRVFKCKTKYGNSVVAELDDGMVHLPSMYANHLIQDGELNSSFIVAANFFRYHGEKTSGGSNNTDFPYFTHLRIGCMCVENCEKCMCCQHAEEKGFLCPCIQSGLVKVRDIENYFRKVGSLNSLFDDLFVARLMMENPTEEMKAGVASLAHIIPVAFKNLL